MSSRTRCLSVAYRLLCTDHHTLLPSIFGGLRLAKTLHGSYAIHRHLSRTSHNCTLRETSGPPKMWMLLARPTYTPTFATPLSMDPSSCRRTPRSNSGSSPGPPSMWSSGSLSDSTKLLPKTSVPPPVPRSACQVSSAPAPPVVMESVPVCLPSASRRFMMKRETRTDVSLRCACSESVGSGMRRDATEQIWVKTYTCAMSPRNDTSCRCREHQPRAWSVAWAKGVRTST